MCFPLGKGRHVSIDLVRVYKLLEEQIGTFGVLVKEDFMAGSRVMTFFPADRAGVLLPMFPTGLFGGAAR